MAIAVDPNQKIPFVLKRDKDLPKEQQTIFYSRVMSVRRMQELASQYEKKGPKVTMAFTLDNLTKLINEFLAGWDNFHLSDGTTAVFELEPSSNGTKTISRRSWAYIDSLEFITELFQGCFEANQLGETTIKN